MRLISSEGDALVLPPGHRFPVGKYLRVTEILAREHPGLMQAAPRASWEELGLVHDGAYLTAVRGGGLDPGALRRLSFPWSEGAGEPIAAIHRRDARGAGLAFAHGAAGHLAGGTHHAFRDRGEGFCVFNDLAVTIAVARRDHGAARPAVIDLDVHQGNGTAALFAGDEAVFTLSLHGGKNYPFRKEQSSLDVALPDGCEDDLYLRGPRRRAGTRRGPPPGPPPLPGRRGRPHGRPARPAGADARRAPEARRSGLRPGRAAPAFPSW